MRGNKVAVYIGTTGGPVRIERITSEPVPLSEVFVGRGVKPVDGLSDDYDNFVRPGRPVARAFGPFAEPSFRMDISAEIKTGQSWQLAMFIAHGLHGQGRLAGPDDPAAEVLWLTGCVNADFAVESVGHISEKLHASKGLFADCTRSGVPVTAVMPPGEGTRTLPDIRPNIDFVQPENALVFARETLKLAVADSIGAKVERRHTYLKATAAFLLVAAIGGGVWHGVSGGGVERLLFTQPPPLDPEPAKPPVASPSTLQPKPAPEPAPEPAPKPAPKPASAPAPAPAPAPASNPVVRSPIQPPALIVHERRAPGGKTCAHVFFGAAQVLESTVFPKDAAAVPPPGALCGFRFAVPGGADGVRAELTVRAGRYVGMVAKTITRNISTGGDWVIDIPADDGPPLAFSLKMIGPRGAIIARFSH